MKIEHSTIEGFADDLKRVAGSHDDTIVRSEIMKQRENAGVENVSVVCGFCDDRCLYEMTVPCGEDLSGGDCSGTNEAELFIETMQEICKDLKVYHGRGRWCLSE